MTPRLILGRLRRSSLAQNAAALYAAHVAGLILPLLAIPFLARVLRPEGWGMVVFAQSFAAALTLVLEYGFYLSATREIARKRDDREELARIVAAVQSAKLLLLGGVTLLVVAAYFAIPLFREHPAHLAWAWGLAAAQGFSAYWYFQGVERLRLPALTEVVAKAGATAMLFLLIRTPGDGWMVLAIFAVPTAAWALFTNLWIYRELPRLPLRVGAGARMLRETVRLFVFRAALGSYVAANSFILGALATPQVVGFFAGAERLIRGAINLIHPATQAIYPRISNLVVNDRGQAARLLGWSLLAVGGLGLVMGLTAAIAAPLLVRVLLGPGYEAAVPVLRALSVLPPIIAVGTVLGLQWALPTGLDRPYFRLVITGAVVNVALAILLVPRFGALGMAGAIITAECLVTGGLLVLVWLHGREMWGAAVRGVMPGRGTVAAEPGVGLGVPRSADADGRG
jgi:polysaccharide transporter, PST family